MFVEKPTASFLCIAVNCHPLVHFLCYAVFTMWIQNLTCCSWIAVPHSESEEEIQDNRPSIEFSDLDDDLEEEY